VWKHFQTSTSIEAMWNPKGEEVAEKSEFATAAFIPYQTPNYRIEYTLAKSSVPRAWWRSVEHPPVASSSNPLWMNWRTPPVPIRWNFVSTSLARTARSGLHQPKEGKPLDTAALKPFCASLREKADWGKPLPKDIFRGIRRLLFV